MESSETVRDLGVLGSRPGSGLSPLSGPSRPLDHQWRGSYEAGSSIVPAFQGKTAASPDDNDQSQNDLEAADLGLDGSGDAADPLDLAASLAERLAEALRQIHRLRIGGPTFAGREGTGEARVAPVETDTNALDRARHLLAGGPSAEDIGQLHTLLSAWLERPTDLLVMIKLSESAAVLATLVDLIRELRAALEVD